LVKQTIRLVLRNVGSALRVSVGPLAILVLLMLASPAFLTGSTLFSISTFFVSWVAVAWYRYVLREELPGGYFPPFYHPETLRHLLWSFAFLMGATVLAGVLFGILVAIFHPLARSFGLTKDAVAMGSLLLALPLITYLGLRLGLVLPAAALGRPMTILASWRATRGSHREILSFAALGAAVLATIATAGPALVGLTLVHSLGHVSGSADLAVWLLLAAVLALSWLSMMLVLAALTTLYGHLVEGRPLPA
jgi:hypothetical protein